MFLSILLGGSIVFRAAIIVLSYFALGLAFGITAAVAAFTRGFHGWFTLLGIGAGGLPCFGLRGQGGSGVGGNGVGCHGLCPFSLGVLWPLSEALLTPPFSAKDLFMDYILALDTTIGGFTLALGQQGVLLGGVADATPRSSSALHPALEIILKQNDTKPSQIKTIAIMVGPGSFTGCRIGKAFAESWRLAQPQVRVVGLSTLAVLARQAIVLGVAEPFRVLLDAAGGQVYGQDFNAQGTPQAAAFCLPLAEAVATPLPVVAAHLPLCDAAKWHIGGVTPEVLFEAVQDTSLHGPAEIVYLKDLNYKTKTQALGAA